jgi:hypothetical protein
VLNQMPNDMLALLRLEPPSPALSAAGREPLWTVEKDSRQLACELRDHGEWGVEVQVYREREFLYGRRWATRALALDETDEQKAAYLDQGGMLTATINEIETLLLQLGAGNHPDNMRVLGGFTRFDLTKLDESSFLRSFFSRTTRFLRYAQEAKVERWPRSHVVQ